MHPIWVALPLCLALSLSIRAEVYTALAELEELLETESVLLRTLHQYISDQEQRIASLKKHAYDYEKEHKIAAKDITNYLSNPINDYLLVKRLTSDWYKTEKLMQDPYYDAAMKNLTQYRELLKFPTEEDLSGAATALMRLQDTYKLDTSSVARGELNGIQYSTQLTAGDCFELGRQSYNGRDFYHTELWMNEALRRHEEERSNSTTDRWEILEYLAYSTFMQGNLKKALQLTNELLVLFPNHERALGNRAYYEAAIKNGTKDMEKSDSNQRSMGSTSLDPEERDRYQMLCRNEKLMSVKESSKLHCRYTTKNNQAFLIIAPLKEEEAFLSPRIVLYHDILYNNEIDVIKRLAQPRLRRATVQNYKTGELEFADYRISKSAWLKEHEDNVIANVAKRVETMTGLTTETAEELQVVNYGVGGHYDPHYDFARREETNAFKSLGTGNRIATVLFYMSDVAQGGATVFPWLGVALKPVKGTAAVWFNLYPSGNGDLRTRHAACPVLQGSKWVCNKWLHEVGQEFKRPCDPKENIEATSQS
ncbi:prolyl 4-hydroxylase subunit alpha-1-like [Daktulosphaira vitifoliae]|uniref:prolyl 4-hydroxylase subunit alpha-1-like n=1 Tax=Daktulosphaira vitifoliae TaxID=58002 RepID=UPI0021AA9E8F|nr:prolyl 4-hydroxylase subunit alpha-1-like [Daktulosphaira vitifoliae]